MAMVEKSRRWDTSECEQMCRLFNNCDVHSSPRYCKHFKYFDLAIAKDTTIKVEVIRPDGKVAGNPAIKSVSV